MSNKPHPTVKVKVGDIEADIDVDIAPLVEQIWLAGIVTTNSCQENKPGIVWIEFLTTEETLLFLNVVAGPHSSEPSGLYNRIVGSWDTKDGPPEGRWEHSVNLFDWSVNSMEDDEGYLEETQEGPPDLCFSHSIRFPRTDLPTLESRMRLYNMVRIERR